MIFHNGVTASVLVGDCLATLRTIPDNTFNCCVTSPPYFGLRDYGHEGQIGLEDTPEEFVARLVEVFREVRRTLADDGTLWVNIGDSYATGTKAEHQQSTNPGVGSNRPEAQNSVPPIGTPIGCKTKDLIGIPWMLAFALRADGWYLRQEIIWHKPNPMPESVRDRCTKAHEQIFLLSKSPRYFYDVDAMRETAVSAGARKATRTPTGNMDDRGVTRVSAAQKMGTPLDGKRNRRSVWSVNTNSYAGAHFAVFPPELIEPCILAGCPVGGIVLDPFMGSGTTAGVSVAHGRHAFGLELSGDYAALMPERVRSIVAKLGAA